MVDESYLLLDWDSPSYSISRFQSIFRHQSLGLGCSFGTPRPRGPRPLALCFPRTSHQQFGVTSSFPSTPTFSESQLQILRDGSVRQLVWELLYWCHHRNIHIQVRHIPGKLNVLAYSLSRPNRILSTEWSLDQGIAHQIFKLWGTPQVDLFATRLNHLLPLFVSPVPDHRACAVDAMSLDWKNLFAYAFPSSKLVLLVLNKIRDSSSRFILIAPFWPQRSWFSVILTLIIDFPRELPVHCGLVSQYHGEVLHNNPSMLHLHVWMLSEVKSEVDTFLSSLPNAHLSPAESLRSRSILQDGWYSQIGVSKGKLILSIPL